MDFLAGSSEVAANGTAVTGVSGEGVTGEGGAGGAGVECGQEIKKKKKKKKKGGGGGGAEGGEEVIPDTSGPKVNPTGMCAVCTCVCVHG